MPSCSLRSRVEGHVISPPDKVGLYTPVAGPLEEGPSRRTGMGEGPQKAGEGEKSRGEITRFRSRSRLGPGNENQRRG